MNSLQKSKRDKLTIMMRILDISRTAIKKTHLLYKANINFYQLTKYLDLLTSVSMLEKIEFGYRITEKGLQFLHMLELKDSVIEQEIAPYQLIHPR